MDFASKLKKQIEQYNTDRKPARKAAITKLINQAILSGVENLGLNKILDEIDAPEWLKQRFKKGSFFVEGTSVYGWWSHTEQQQTCLLPLFRGEIYGEASKVFQVSFFHIKRDEQGLWRKRGFIEASKIPLTSGLLGSTINIDWRQDNLEDLRKAGYSPPCALQYTRTDESLFVDRSIISHGFWKAWKWWEGADKWYLSHRPELFWDLDIWGDETPKRYYPNEPAAAVLGGDTERLAGMLIRGVICEFDDI